MTARLALALVVFIALPLHERRGAAAEQSAPPQGASEKSAADGPAERQRAFHSALAGTKLVGRFTTVGKPLGNQSDEEYTIHNVTKLPAGDYWLFQTRIRYGHKDVTVPLPLEVKWAENTPVITLTELTIPGIGTFSARVVVHDGLYAGTWRHGDVAGHLFGQIQKLEPEEEQPPRE